MALTLYNKLIVSNRKGQAMLAGGASAVILGVSAFRHLEDDDKQIDPVRIGSFAILGGLVTGLVWGVTRSARRKAGKQGREIATNAVKPVATIGLMATLQDMENERYMRKVERNGGVHKGSSNTYNYRYSNSSSASSSGSSSGSTSYPGRLSNNVSWTGRDSKPDYTDLPSYGSAEEEDDDSLTSLGGSPLLSMVSKAEGSRSYDNPMFDDEDDDADADALSSSSRSSSVIGNILI